jgi:hypothetical protein
MKVRLTESQFNKLKLVKEDENVNKKFDDMHLQKFYDFVGERVKRINLIWGKVSNVTLFEILNNEFNVKSIERELERMEKEVRSEGNRLYQLWDNSAIGIGEDNYDIEIEDIKDLYVKKHDVLESILYAVEKMQQEEEDNEEDGKTAMSIFGDVKPLSV